MKTAACSITLDEAPRPEDIATVSDGLDAYNLEFAPPHGHRPLHIFLRAQDQRVVGGLIGGTAWGWLYVDRLWLAADQRRQGYGTQLLAAAEEEARRRGCRHAHLDTLSFQALPFYERHGYSVWGVLEDLPPGHRRSFIKKELTLPA